MHLLGIVQLVKPWNRVGYHHPHFLFHMDFCVVLSFAGMTISYELPQARSSYSIWQD